MVLGFVHFVTGHPKLLIIYFLAAILVKGPGIPQFIYYKFSPPGLCFALIIVCKFGLRAPIHVIAYQFLFGGISG